MATLASAKRKLATKIPTMPAAYNQGVADFLGISASAVGSSGPGMAYSGKVKPGMENKWETNLKRAFGA